MTAQGLLAGMRVVEGAAFVAAPSGAMTLAQLGAEVVRFDQIGGGIDYGRWPITAEGRSLYWAGLNKGKKSIAVNLRDRAARELLSDLIAAAGTFLTNFPARGWMAPGPLTDRRDDLVMVVITGNRDGTTAVDYTVNAALGFPMITGPEGLNEPVNSVIPAWDLLCGQAASTAILAAERHRLLTAEGSIVSIALSDVALAATAALGYVAEAQLGHAQRPRSGNDLYGAFGVALSTSDHRRLYAVAISARQWDALVDATESRNAVAAIAADTGLDLGLEGDRYLARGEIKAVMQRWAGARTLKQAKARFDALGVCWGPYQSFGELVAQDPRLSPEAGLFRWVDQPGIGRILAPRSPLVVTPAANRPESGDEVGAAPRSTHRRPDLTAQQAAAGEGTAPMLGEHTEEVLADWLGLSAAEIGRLHDDGVVAGAAQT